jgi:deazaflavin-dependent oxidoreductase (nitroreductase family)
MTAPEPQYLYLTTTGWRSGRSHRIEIWFTTLQEHWYVLAEHGDRAHWVQNLRHQPLVQVLIADTTYEARARLVDDVEEPSLAQQVRARSIDKYGWGGGSIVELEAVSAATHH